MEWGTTRISVCLCAGVSVCECGCVCVCEGGREFAVCTRTRPDQGTKDLVTWMCVCGCLGVSTTKEFWGEGVNSLSVCGCVCVCVRNSALTKVFVPWV